MKPITLRDASTVLELEPLPDKADRFDESELLYFMRLSRECDRRESMLQRQGKGWFHLSGAGHESVAAIAFAMRTGDYLFPHYRDRALLLALGVSVYDIALGYFAKADSSSGGRQMPSHFSSPAHGVVSLASPTAMHCLTAAGAAWAFKREGQSRAVICCSGEASIRQGEFYEAYSFALQESLPIVFVVEDNGFGISTRTEHMNPFRIGALPLDRVTHCKGDPRQVFDAAIEALDLARAGLGPSVLWIDLERLDSHASADDQRAYRSSEELERARRNDPLRLLEMTRADGSVEVIRHEVDDAYQRAFLAADPNPEAVTEHVLAPMDAAPVCAPLPDRDHWTIASAVNYKLAEFLARDERVLLLGEDIEDPKGGVFGLTQGLSTRFPDRVHNAPLAEATIAGVAGGLALAGRRPIIEFQFVDFTGPAFHQIANQLATIRWRSRGEWKCPVIMLAPCGGYSIGGPWHSQSNESLFTHIPGLRVVEPSTPWDVAGFLELALASEDPTLILIPKHLFRVKTSNSSREGFSFGEAALRRTGEDMTVLAWGNCVSITLKSADALQERGISVEVIDVRSLSPCDWPTLAASVKRTRRLAVVQEDARESSFGESLIAGLLEQPEVFQNLLAPPVLISRPSVHVPYNPTLERAVLPSEVRVVEELYQLHQR
jgi:2-oxoisovalerate dehydrogenase E1 component